MPELRKVHFPAQPVPFSPYSSFLLAQRKQESISSSYYLFVLFVAQSLCCSSLAHGESVSNGTSSSHFAYSFSERLIVLFLCEFFSRTNWPVWNFNIVKVTCYILKYLIISFLNQQYVLKLIGNLKRVFLWIVKHEAPFHALRANSCAALKTPSAWSCSHVRGRRNYVASYMVYTELAPGFSVAPGFSKADMPYHTPGFFWLTGCHRTEFGCTAIIEPWLWNSVCF